MTRTHPHTGTLSPIRAAPGYPSDLADKIGVSRQILSYQLACQRRCGLDPDRGNRNGDRRNRRKGVFGVVHNLIFTAMMVFGFGIALLTTNFVAIVGFVSSVAMIELQVRVAEAPYLLAVHGDAYRDYVATVGRFIPGAGGPTRDDGAGCDAHLRQRR
jgi:hypothetical protein